ncbi:MAG: cupin domain-containing protein [Candidatus Omnitrophica bacterium]|nr:cupin domain-containing protein [Candidatus Omnitrophota bacterium]MDO9572758.1 cupin domain-containing protein [Candidatus Omnitrophota bacterium]
MSKEKVFCTQLKGRQRFLRLFGDSSKAKGLRSGFVVLKPKESVGLHNTGPSEEVIFIISGSGLICYGEKNSLKVKKNIFVYIPPKIPHNVINTGKHLLKYVYTAARV